MSDRHETKLIGGMNLTPSQERYLAEIREAGRRSYNGRARRPLTALRDAGLIELDYDLIPQAKGNGIEMRERFTARVPA